MPLILPSSAEERLLRRWTGALERPGPASAGPTLLVCWPYARMNKYQALLYGRAARHGYVIHPITRLEELDAVSWPGEVVFHAHWFAGLHAACATDAEALDANRAGFAQILAFRERTGARLLWTAHNLFPHNTRFPEASLELRRRTMEHFDLVHVMEAEHTGMLHEAYGIAPRRSIVVPHMTYDGVYPDHVEPEAARAALDVPASALVFLAFGSIQPYKGLDQLVPAFRAAVEGNQREAMLVIAGVPTDPATVAEVERLSGGDRRITVDARRIPDDEVQLFFRAADVAVLPYAQTLNSGTAALALTFGKPLVALT